MKKIILLIMAFLVMVYCYFGGFTTGDYVNGVEFKDEIVIPSDKRIIALGEATHGNKEFQELKLSIFKKLVEENGVRAFAIEGDFGGCLEVNEYIHGKEGTTLEAVKKIGFKIYQTKEMMDLIDYMRDYNLSHIDDDINFYGFDMQRTEYLDKEYSDESINLYLKEIKRQNKEVDNSLLRDKYMAQNIEWILEREDKVFVCAHNEHIARWGSYDSMGKLLSLKEENGYYAIGTDFYKSRCNLPSKSKRIVRTFFSHDPLTKSLKMSGKNVGIIDTSELEVDYIYMGTLGESYSFMNRLIPQSYRMFQPPKTMYDAMVLFVNVNPTDIIE